MEVVESLLSLITWTPMNPLSNLNGKILKHLQFRDLFADCRGGFRMGYSDDNLLAFLIEFRLFLRVFGGLHCWLPRGNR